MNSVEKIEMVIETFRDWDLLASLWHSENMNSKQHEPESSISIDEHFCLHKEEESMRNS